MSCTGPLVLVMLETRASLIVAVGRWKFSTLVGVEKPDGSSGATVNWAVAGMFRVKRVTARSTTFGRKVALRAFFVEISALGAVPSSTRLNSGARPSVSLNSCLFAAVVIVQPWSGL